MKKTTFALLLTSSFALAGGELGELNIDQQMEQIDMQQAEATITPTPLPTLAPTPTKEVVKPEIAPIVPAPKFYVGASVANSNIDTSNNNTIIKNSKPILTIGKIGYNLYEDFSIEGRAGTGIKKDEIGFTSNDVSSIIGGFIKPNFKLANNLNLFGLFGYAQTKMEQGTLKSEMKGVSYGAGLSYALDSNFNFVADAVRYGKEDAHQVDLFSLGLEYLF